MPPRTTLSEVGRQNIVYSDAEQTVINNALETTEAGLLRLSTLRSNGAARRHQLKDNIRRYKVALAPYKKIPKEIWMYIFELYCQSGRLSTCAAASSPPVLLTHVCSAWRQIVLSIPKLWSNVFLGEDVNIARICLERAGDIPRALETSRRSAYRFNRSQTIQSFICSFPFRKLHLTTSYASRIDFAGIPVESLLLLEDLAIFNADFPSRVNLSPHQFPNLVALHIDGNSMPHFHVSRPFATWKKLRVLRLECTRPLAACLAILRDASSVEDCSLHVFGRVGQNSTFKNVVVPNLKFLTLSFSGASWSILDHLTIPNLHTLILFSRYSNINLKEFDKSPLLRLAQRVGSLRSLNIHHLYVNVDVGLVLECLPLLQVLELHCQKITTHTVEKIGSGELGGCLRELHDWSSRNLYQFLQACELRRDVTQGQCPNSPGVIARLEKVSVKFSKKETGCKRRIRELRKDGVKFVVFRGSREVQSA